ncbi:MAG: hypothetical protein EAY75_09720 [Bacteroidetes bacterium]|nr:MAG: hypothetical protein EAY75_09720 [Bacteroidota bacterium]
MKQFGGFLLLLTVVSPLVAQDVATLMEEGRRLEQKFKDDEALAKYKQAQLIDPANLLVQVKLAETYCALGSRQADAAAKATFYTQAKTHADAALRLGADDADANYMAAVVAGKLTEIETKRENLVKQVRLIKDYADKALAARPNMGKAMHVLGKWHYEILALSAVKRAAIKVLYGGLPEANIDTAIAYFEKAKMAEPYYCLLYLDLAKAYNYRKLYEKAINNLQQLSKLPTRRQEDVVVKAEGAALLQTLQ